MEKVLNRHHLALPNLAGEGGGACSTGRIHRDRGNRPGSLLAEIMVERRQPVEEGNRITLDVWIIDLGNDAIQ